MNQAQKCLSPAKQNRSPAKDSHNVNDFLAIAKSAGILVPASIEAKLTETKEQLLKVRTIANGKQADEIKKLKVKLGDAEFELRKVEEDFAQFKLLSKQEKDKEVRKWEEAYHKLKRTSEENNEDSSEKLLKMRSTSEKEIVELQSRQQVELEQQKSVLTTAFQNQLNSYKRGKELQIAELKHKHEEIIADLQLKHQQEIQASQSAHQSEIRKQALKFKQTLESKERNFESIYTALQSEKKTEVKLHENTKIEASQAKEKLYSELYYQKNINKGLKENIQALEKQVKSFKSTITDLQITLQLEKEKAARAEKAIISDWESRKAGVEELHKQHTAQLLSQHQKQLQLYQQKIEQIEQFKKNSETLLIESQQQIQQKFNERPSRRGDLDMIDKLKSKVARRQQQIRALNRQLRKCALEIENKQQTYNKIFTANKIEKKMLTRREQFKSRDSLCRKSHTTDIKFLLKVYNKNL